MTTLIISNEEMDDIVKIIKSHEESFLLIKRVRKTIKIKEKIQRVAYLCMLSFTLDASLLGNLLTGERTKRSTIPG